MEKLLELFTLTDITDFVIENQGWVEENLYRLQEMLKSKTEPKIEIGNQCNSPFSCEYRTSLLETRSENSVFGGTYTEADIKVGNSTNRKF